MDELEQLQAEIQELQRKAMALQAERKHAVIAEIRSKIKAYDLTEDDLFGTVVTKTRGAAPVAAKYRIGDQTWSGRGKRPRWVQQYLLEGGQLEDLLIQ